MILGVDVGGTSVKFGLVSSTGKIDHYKTFDTKKEIEKRDFASFLKLEIAPYLKEFPAIKGVGIGFPGLLSKERKDVLLLPNIPSVVNLPIVEILKKEFPDKEIRIENDAKCATIGELHFGEDKSLDNFLLITLGTGVGSGVIINRKLFLGARGNGLELGHILIDHEKTLEQNIGLSNFTEYSLNQIKSYKSQTLLSEGDINPKSIYEAAIQHDALALLLFSYMGRLLGQALVSTIRILDLNHIILGGGISGAFEFIVPEIKNTLTKFLPRYYTDSLKINKASLGNYAGLLGAASLLMDEKVN